MFVALLTIGVGVLGAVNPEGGTALRRLYFATPARLYAAGAIRLTMGLVLIGAASSARWPRIVLALGALMCIQALSGTMMGPEHARAILEWESIHSALLRAGAAVALVTGVFIAFAVGQAPIEERL
jgi:hypothetical protein